MSSKTDQQLSVQFGCGLRAPEEWINFDVSPTLRLSRIPGLRSLLRLPAWPANARYGDVVKGLPLAEGSCRRLYCDQVLEHLCREDVHTALKNCQRLLATDGVFRLFVPDLYKTTMRYLVPKLDNGAEAFMETMGLGFTHRPRSPKAWIREWLGNSRHLWAWDARSMGAALKAAGFTQVREVDYRDSGDAMFDILEGPIEWELALGMEARKA